MTVSSIRRSHDHVLRGLAAISFSSRRDLGGLRNRRQPLVSIPHVLPLGELGRAPPRSRRRWVCGARREGVKCAPVGRVPTSAVAWIGRRCAGV